MATDCAHNCFYIIEDTSTPGADISGADVVLFGLNTVIPLMSEDLLRVSCHMLLQAPR